MEQAERISASSQRPCRHGSSRSAWRVTGSSSRRSSASIGKLSSQWLALERTRIKIRMHLDSAPARQYHGQATSHFVLRRRFLRGQLHLHQPACRRNRSTPSLPTSFLQMAIQCAEAQTSTLAKFAPPHTADHKLGHQLLNFRSGTSLGR
jgi:hypothetical protein